MGGGGGGEEEGEGWKVEVERSSTGKEDTDTKEERNIWMETSGDKIVRER